MVMMPILTEAAMAILSAPPETSKDEMTPRKIKPHRNKQMQLDHNQVFRSCIASGFAKDKAGASLNIRLHL